MATSGLEGRIARLEATLTPKRRRNVWYIITPHDGEEGWKLEYLEGAPRLENADGTDVFFTLPDNMRDDVGPHIARNGKLVARWVKATEPESARK
jgi:hypothetical protein